MSDTFRAAFWMIGTIVSFSIMAVAGREVSADHDTFEVMFYRSLIGFFVVSTVLTVTRRWSVVRLNRWRSHLFRNSAHFIGQNLWFFAVTVIPLSQVFALEFTSPIWVIVLSPLILGERITKIRTVAAIMGFIGILIVARPTIEGINTGVVTAASSAIFFALTIMLTKKLTRYEQIGSILFHLTAMQLVMGLVAAGYDGDLALPQSGTAIWLLLIGVAGLLAHFCYTNALSLAPATFVVPFEFIRLPAIAFIGMLVYAEMLDIWVFVGAAIIFAGNYLNIWFESRQNSQI